MLRASSLTISPGKQPKTWHLPNHLSVHPDAHSEPLPSVLSAAKISESQWLQTDRLIEDVGSIVRELPCYSEYIKPLKSMCMPQAGQMEKTKYRERHCRTFFMFHHNPHKTGLPHFQHCYPGSDEHEHLAANPAALFATTFNTSQLLMCHVRPSV